MLEEQAWGRQVFADLAISLVVAWSFLRPDAKARGIPAVPYIVATLAVGSIGMLPYLIHRELRRAP